MQNLSARNPLSIIALFISLIYGIAALLLGTSVKSLANGNQNLLVNFIILFPVAVLFAFLYLVTWHHRKLYGPGDFRSDEGFLSAGDPAAIGLKYIEESVPDLVSIEEVQLEAAVPTTDGPSTPQAETPNSGIVEARFTAHGDSSAKAVGVAHASLSYMLEGLVMQELQNEYSSPIRRDAQIALPNGRRARIDGIIEAPDGPLLVEVKHITEKSEWRRRIRDGIDSLRRHISSFEEISDLNVRGIIVLVHSGSLEKKDIQEAVERIHLNRSAKFIVRLYNADELFSKYGITQQA